MTKYQEFVANEIRKVADDIGKIGTDSDFSELFAGGRKIKADDIALRLEWLAATIRHEDFMKVE